MTVEDVRNPGEPLKQIRFTDDQTNRVYYFPSDFVPDPYETDDTEVTLRSYDRAVWVKISFGNEEK